MLFGAEFAPVCAKHRGAPAERKEDAMRVTRRHVDRGAVEPFQLKEDVQNNKSCLTLNKTSDELKNAPTIDKVHMPDFTDAKWRQTVDDFFGVRTVARPPETNR